MDITETSFYQLPIVNPRQAEDIKPSLLYEEKIYQENGVWYKAIYNEGCLKSLITLASNKTTYIQEVVFHDDGITQKMIIPYVNGVREGIVYAFHKNGKVKLIVPIKGNKKEGNRREYNDSGVLIEECFYVANKKNGGYKKYDPYTGRCIIQANYRNDFLEGDKKSYDDQSNLVKVERFVNGESIEVFAYTSIPNSEVFGIL